LQVLRIAAEWTFATEVPATMLGFASTGFPNQRGASAQSKQTVAGKEILGLLARNAIQHRQEHITVRFRTRPTQAQVLAIENFDFQDEISDFPCLFQSLQSNATPRTS
jgi:hypothetical protein